MSKIIINLFQYKHLSFLKIYMSGKLFIYFVWSEKLELLIQQYIVMKTTILKRK